MALPMQTADTRAANVGPGSLRRTLLLYLGALLAVFAVALLFAARDYGQRAANRSYDHLLVSSALSIADSVALVDGHWQVDLPYAALTCWQWPRKTACSIGSPTAAAR